MQKTFNIEVYRHINYGYTVIVKECDHYKDNAEYVLIATGTATTEDEAQETVLNAQIDALKSAKREVQANCEIMLEKLEEEIQSLLAIAHSGGL
jgi:hypothetical protein